MTWEFNFIFLSAQLLLWSENSFVIENLKWLQSVLLLELDKLKQTTVACLAKDIHDCSLLTVTTDF